MTGIFLGLGSNTGPRHHLSLGLAELRELLGPLEQSAVYEGAAIGFEGDPFWNLVVRAETGLSVGELQAALRAIEYRHGRPQNATRLSARTLDIDILTFGDTVGVVDGVELPRGEITTHAFVLRPLAELAPDCLHPALGVSFGALWEGFDDSGQGLVRVELGV
ncbi:MAG: 2-amino-4-hydroxy-6-hydroxymethyldihydropteridine diphosphokinase [Halieaceae bacterium]|jgi:2-amino-4-hydroxy-6-hydroxymethyldihydropteridine diphosphokinase|nr:2-amino-4-hydroxy-6-hydroxymethyldihydropteridine diphosphokinase [Halieaceae bacterium]